MSHHDIEIDISRPSSMDVNTQLRNDLIAENVARGIADEEERAARIAGDQHEADERQGQINALQQALDAEQSSRDAAISSLSTTMANDHSTVVQYVDSVVSSSGISASGIQAALSTRINQEAQDRDEADVQIISALQTEIDARIAAIESEKNSRSQADTQLSTAIANEASARQSAVVGVESALSSEAVARAGADTTLSNAINGEISARQAAVSSTNGAVSSEAAARAAADITITNSVTTEINDRKAADTAITTSVTNETTARQQADTTLTTNLAAEASSRQNADTTEANTRASADTAIQSSVTALTTRVVTLESKTAATWAELKAVTMPAITVGGSTDLTITWTTPAPNANYSVFPTIIGSNISLLGNVTAVVKSKTATSAVVTLKNNGLSLISINTGQIEALGIKFG